MLCGLLVGVSENDPVTGRRMLAGSAYADDRHLRSRMSIYAYAETAADPRWRTSLIPWDGTQVVADVGCGNGFDLRQIVPQGRCRHAIGLDLSAGMLRSLEDLRLWFAAGRRLGRAISLGNLVPSRGFHMPEAAQLAVREIPAFTGGYGTLITQRGWTGPRPRTGSACAWSP
jgi:SAM-dependent methyltransferase